MTPQHDEMTRQHDEITRRHFEINLTRRRVDSMNWRDEKRTLRHYYAARRDEHFVQELTPYFKTSSNFPRSPFWSARKALWGDDVRWLLDSHVLGKFVAKCRIALLLSVVFKLKTGKRIPKFAFTSFRMMWQYDERGFMLLEGRRCPKIHVCVRSTSKSIASKNLTSWK